MIFLLRNFFIYKKNWICISHFFIKWFVFSFLLSAVRLRVTILFFFLNFLKILCVRLMRSLLVSVIFVPFTTGMIATNDTISCADFNCVTCTLFLLYHNLLITTEIITYSFFLKYFFSFSLDEFFLLHSWFHLFRMNKHINFFHFKSKDKKK